ncbi:hypothetical protein ACOBQX_22795 [Actinokineospora sp. G85]|uniref:hypothetical protein n=1 Tax=Actinokineospora sp. G85 TaxID=3406626 RepID=UPI003C796817
MTEPLTLRTDPAQVRIGLWGPPGSGKTTFLAALWLAVTRYNSSDWMMSGIDDSSERFLAQTVDLLTDKRAFPSQTMDAQGLLFNFSGTRVVERRNRLGRRVTEKQPVSFELDVLDVPGGVFQYRNHSDPRSQEPDDGLELSPRRGPEGAPNDVDQERKLISHLRDCDGILYLFDPERDHNQGDSFKYFHPVLQKLTRSFAEQHTHQGKLPHHVAVCVTKFDQPEIFEQARKFGYTVNGNHPPFMPHVPDHLADAFFKTLCADPMSNTDLLEMGLRRHFSTLNYFVTSAIGFYTDGKRFRATDSGNTERVAAGQAGMRIRGQVRPINVFEPLLWLFESVLDKQAR